MTKPAQAPAAGAPSRLYEAVAEALRANIREGVLAPGVVVQESALAAAFQTSRAPVQKGLAILEREGLLRRHAGRGFVVAGAAASDAVVRAEDLRLTPDLEKSFSERASWQRLYGEVEKAIASHAPFGCWQIVESRMASHFGVSRTVVREVMGQLEQWGLVERLPPAQWRAGPLSAEAMAELYQARRMLEPAMLEQVGPELPGTELEAMGVRVEEALAAPGGPSIEQINAVEQDLHVQALARLGNARLQRMLRQTQLPLVATGHLFERYLGVPSDLSFLREHGLAIALLRQGAWRAAAAALDAHLESACRTGIERLGRLAAIDGPEPPDYLVKAGRKPAASAEPRTRR